MNEVSSAAVIGAVAIYLAKSVYELVRQRNGRNGRAPEARQCSSEVLQLLRSLSTTQIKQTGIMEELAKTQSAMAGATQLIAERTAILVDRGERN